MFRPVRNLARLAAILGHVFSVTYRIIKATYCKCRYTLKSGMEVQASADWYRFTLCQHCGVKIQTILFGVHNPAADQPALLRRIQQMIQDAPNHPPAITAEMLLAQYNAQNPATLNHTLAQFDAMTGQELCRGQGTCYASRTSMQTPDFANHNKFDGYYEDCCCYCAVVVMNWPMTECMTRGCYLCKDPLIRCRAFKRIRQSTTFWAQLPEPVFNHIMSFLANRNERRTILVDV